MRRNSRRGLPEGLRVLAVRGALALLLACLLVAPIAVQAELKATSLAYSWDVTADAFEWGHATIEWDGSWIPLLQEIYFDQLDRPPEPDEPQICADPTKTTRYAGWIEYGLPHVDNEPEGARGFQESRNWTLIDCDLNGDGIWDRDDLLVGPFLDFDVHPELKLADCTPGGANCNILTDLTSDPVYYQDKEDDCTVATEEHCLKELSTMLVISIDTDCDGVVDDPRFTDAVALCVYSEVLTPDYEAWEDNWTFPLPVRIMDADGAKTLMLYPDPTAVELASFSVGLEGGSVMVRWETATELDNVGFNLYRANAGGGEQIRLSERLIPSQDPGSTVGSRYQFVDRSAQPGMAYEYWLEDIDLGGAGTMNGPVSVQMPRARCLPSRPRPAPMPGQWE